jgi:hypothetical protein
MKWIGGNMKRWNRSIAFHYLKVFLLVAAVTGFSARGALAAIFTGSSGTLSASAEFVASGSNLVVTLTNTSLNDVLVPADVLTAVFFSLSGDPLLGKTSAVLGSGSSVFFGVADPGDVVGGEWAYARGLGGNPDLLGANQGISSSGLGVFAPGNRFPGNNLQGPADPDGIQYGIASAGDDPSTGNAPVTGANALIRNQVVFTLSGLPTGSSISNVWFQYGTSLDEPNIPPPPGTPVPEPASLLLFGSGLVVFAGWGRKHLNSKKASD